MSVVRFKCRRDGNLGQVTVPVMFGDTYVQNSE
jgi:hypothetical protein